MTVCRSFYIRFFLAVFLSSVVGCLSPDPQSDVAGEDAFVLFSFNSSRLPEESLKTLIVNVTAEGMDEVLKQYDLEDDDDAGDYDITLTVPSGKDRLFLITVFDAQNEVAYQGSRIIDLAPGAQAFDIALTGYSQVSGILCAIDDATEYPHQGNPVPDFSGSGAQAGRYEISTDADGRFQIDLETGPSIDIYAQDESHSSFARLQPEYGGEDFSVLLLFADIAQEYTLPFLILGVIQPEGQVGDTIELFGLFDESMQSLEIVFSRDVNETYAAPVLSLSDDRISAEVPTGLTLSPLPYVIYLAVPGMPDAVQVSNSFQFTLTD